MKKFFTLMLFGIMAQSLFAASVKVTMNSTSTTMSLKDKATGTAVEVGDPTSKVYTFDASAGTYVLTAYDTDGTTVNGTIELTVSDTETNEFTVLTCTTYATNSGWTVGTDYTVDVKVCTREGVYQDITVGNSKTAGRKTFLALNGNSYYVSLIPSESHQDEGYMTLYKGGTLTSGVTASGAIPTGSDYVVSVPEKAEFAMGMKFAHYVDFTAVEPKSVVTEDGMKKYTYFLASGQVYNYRTWMADGLTQAGYFAMNSDATKRPDLVFTAADYAAFAPKTVKHDVQWNGGYETGDIFVNINERGHLKLNVGDTYDAHALRSWELTDNSTNNYFIEPDFHYTITDVNGNPSTDVITIDNANTTTSPWSMIHAVGNGTAIVTVTYDAIGLNYYNSSAVKTTYMGGEYWSAIWPENTATYVVTVGDGANSIEPNMVINEAYNTDTKKNAGKYVDAEHDVFYYLDTEEGFTYTFTPTGVSKVEIAYPTIGEQKATYSGFAETGVTKNADGSYSLLLKEGRQIVRLSDAFYNCVYQVLTAKPCHREITNVNNPESQIFQRGDKVKIQYSGLRHPANKMAGIYNMSAYVTYNGTPNGTSLILGSGQYTFGSAASAQAVTVTIPLEYEGTSMKLDEGVIQVNGYGDPIGNHRYISHACGRSANFTAVAHKTYFGAIPDVEIPVSDTKNFIAKLTTTPSDATVVVKDVSGNVITPDADGYYTVTYGTYNYELASAGYNALRGSFYVADDAEGEQDVTATMTASVAGAWDGKTTTEPSQIDGTYQISTGAELAWYATQVNAGTVAPAVLTADISLAGYAWTPIGNSSKKLTKDFDGQGHTVSGLYINSTSTYQALFGYIASGAEVKNLTVEGSVTSTANYAAGVVAYCNASKITNVINRATVNGKMYAAGVVAYAYGASELNKLGNEGAISVTSSYAGGVTAYMANTSKLTDAYNTADITSTVGNGAQLAGIVANSVSMATYNATITNVFNTGAINTTNAQRGAIRGTSVSTVIPAITNAYATVAFDLDANYNTTIVTEDQMKSGEVAYLLGESFGQEIGVDETPVLGGMKVYFDMLTGTYTNEDPSIDYTLAVLTFEDADYKGGTNFAGKQNWSSLIDSPQYGGTMLYGSDGMGVDEESKAYNWTDENNTYLHNILSEGWGSWCYWSGGHAISNYGSGDQETYGDYNSQLTVFHKGVEGLTQTGNGHNGSDNFAVHYGYSDNSGWSLTEDALPTLSFADGTARVIDHMYVTNTCYAINCYVSGNSLTPAIGESDWVKIVATGYNGSTKGNTAEIYLCNGPSNIVMDWTKFDLSSLGEVTKVTFNVTGSSDNGYGFSQPAYFAYDDVAVRMPKTETLSIALNAAGYGTFSSAKDMAIQTEGVKAYKASVSGNTITLTELDGYIPAGTGVLLYGEDMALQDVTFATPASDDEAADVTDNDLQPTTTATTYIVDKSTVSGTVWALGKANKFLKYTGSAFVANRAYLVHETQSGAKSMIISFDDDDPTAISNVDSENTDDATYNLAGQRVNSSAKGIVIKNGKKYLIK